MAKKYIQQSMESDVSSIEGALAQAGQVSSPKAKTVSNLANNDPKATKGYERLGSGGPPHTGKAYPPKSKDNRGEGSA